MSTLIKNATILDASSPYAGKQLDLFVRKGKIAKIGKNLKVEAGKTIDAADLFVSPGWVDVLADYREPGFEYKETIRTGLDAAAAGGFTEVCIVPNTQPAIGNASLLDFIKQAASGHKTKLHIMGAVSKHLEGKELAEMMEMQHAGAIAFSDGWLPLQDAGLMLKALEYLKAFNGTLVQIPIHASLSKGGLMTESPVSVNLGMPGIPSMSEALIVHRDLELLRYTGSKLHFSGVTTAASLRLIKSAKKEGLNVSCSVTPYHLLFTDEALAGYDSNFKVEPPLPTAHDRKALVKGLTDGTIDCIATHHRPQDWDAKAKEFEYAGYGMNSQETCWSMLRMAAPGVPMDRWVTLLSSNPRQLFGLPSPQIAENEPANLTIFDQDGVWQYDQSAKKSLGINNPLLNSTLKGKIYTI